MRKGNGDGREREEDGRKEKEGSFELSASEPAAACGRRDVDLLGYFC
jgi:hypothetical protein